MGSYERYTTGRCPTDDDYYEGAAQIIYGGMPAPLRKRASTVQHTTAPNLLWSCNQVIDPADETCQLMWNASDKTMKHIRNVRRYFSQVTTIRLSNLASQNRWQRCSILLVLGDKLLMVNSIVIPLI